MKRLLSIIILIFVLSTAHAQVKLLNMAALQKRISNPDTVYVVNFWATWCKPCIAELPYFEKLQSTYKAQPLKVLLVSMDFKSKLQSQVIPFVNKNQITADTFLADRKNDQEWIDTIDKKWSGALPGTLVVNAKKGLRKFYEQDFTWDELNKLYQTSK